MSATALDHITIKGFKSIKSIEKLPLRPINILIGANGSGKSNFLSVFGLVRAAQEGQLEAYVAQGGGAAKILHFGAKHTEQIEIVLKFSGRRHLDVRLLQAARDELYVHELYQSGDVSWWRLYHVHDTSASSPMRKTASIDDNAFLRTDGSNLAPFLYLLKQKYATSYETIRDSVRRVAPFFDDFVLEPRRLKTDDIRLEWRHRNSDQYFDASSFSDGTLRYIALATLFLQPVELRPSIILVDEPELGLHPAAIGMIAAMIHQTSVETQMIVSTQSSLLLDYFEPQDVLVAQRVDGATQLNRLDANDYSEWLEEYSLGQLWEKNELGGRPVPE